MTTTTPTDSARRLHAVAELIEHLDAMPLSVHLTFDVNAYLCRLGADERRAAVDELAKALGLSATVAEGSTFHEYSAKDHGAGFYLTITTDIAGPGL